MKHFVHEPDGAWRCVSDAEYQSSAGRIQVVAGARFTRGTNFMGVDLARLLDEELRKERSDGGSTDGDARDKRRGDGKAQSQRASPSEDG